MLSLRNIAFHQGKRSISFLKKVINDEFIEEKGLSKDAPRRSELNSNEKLLRLKAQGVLPATIPYNPPDNVETTIKTICKEVLGNKLEPNWKQTQFPDNLLRFKILTKCMETFVKRDIPNSTLHTLKTCQAVCEHFSTPVDLGNPLDHLYAKQLANELPPNLDIKTEYRRFADYPEFWDNMTAFPGRSTHIYNLKYKKLYKDYQTERVWPYERD